MPRLKQVALTDHSGPAEELSGKRDKQSALACSSVHRKQISYVYTDKMRAHLCKRAAARVGMLLYGPKMVVSGL